MNGLLDYLTPDQQQALRQQAATQGLLGIGSALLQGATGAPGQGRPRLGQLLGQAVPVGMQAYQGGMDQALREIVMGQQMQQQRQQREAQARLSSRLTPEQQEQVAAFGPDVLRQIAMPSQEEFTLGEGQRRFRGGQELAAVPKPETLTNEYQNFLKAKEEGFTGSFLDYQTALKAAGRTQVTATATAGGAKDLTPGQKKLDEKAADDIFQWQSGGGQDMAAQIAQLKPVIADLEAGKPITGISVAVQPDLLLAMTNPRALQNREAVEEVVQRNLRVILGAQFTEREGERLISRAFNPKLPPAENAKRVRRLFMQMETAAEQKQAMVDYFNENGTLRGYKGKMPSVSDFERAMEGNVSQPSAAGVRRFNPATGRVE
jgi:hypothetical protein